MKSYSDDIPSSEKVDEKFNAVLAKLEKNSKDNILLNALQLILSIATFGVALTILAKM